MENNGKGIFYGVIGVATLIVAIIGATFAYFTATDEDTETVTGAAEKIGLSVQVEKVTTTAEGKISDNLIPLAGDSLGDAIDGAHGKSVCIDDAGYTACHIYKVTVTNTAEAGAASIAVVGNAVVNSTGENALSDLVLQPVTFADDAYAVAGSSGALSVSTNLVVNTDSDSTIEAGNGTAVYYFVVYLNNDGQQDEQQGGTYTGSVSFSAGAGSEVKATFTASQG